MISIFTMERPAAVPTAAPVGAALAALPPVASSAADGAFAYSSKATGLGNGMFDGVTPVVCHDWTARDRQVDIATLRSSRPLRSPRT